MSVVAVLGLVCTLAPAESHAQIFAGHSADSGAIVLSNFAGGEANTVLIAGPTAAAPVGDVLPAPPRVGSADIQRHVEKAASRSEVPSSLLHAVIAAESNYDVRAVSPRGASGLMQLMPATARRFGAADPFDPEQNVAAGARYLKWLMDLFHGNLELVLASYNAGEQAVINAGRRIPPFPETRSYVKKIMTALNKEGAGT